LGISLEKQKKEGMGLQREKYNTMDEKAVGGLRNASSLSLGGRPKGPGMRGDEKNSCKKAAV